MTDRVLIVAVPSGQLESIEGLLEANGIEFWRSWRKPEHRNKRRLKVEFLRERDGDLCCWCNRKMDFSKVPGNFTTPDLAATLEHVIPKSRNGPTAPWNLKLSCFQCNTARGSDEQFIPSWKVEHLTATS